MSKAKSYQLPLAGRRILITRAQGQASAFRRELERAGARVTAIPTIAIRPPRSFAPLDGALRRIDDYDWLILTSVNGVEALFARLRRLRIPVAALERLRIAAIGPATKRAIEARGLRVTVMPKEYVAESVVAALRKRTQGKRVLLVRARVARDVIPRELRQTAARVDVVEAYETVAPAASKARLAALFGDARRRPHAVTFTSSSTVQNFVKLVGGAARARRLLRGVGVLSIGPVTSATLTQFGIPPTIEAREFTMDGLLRAAVDWSLSAALTDS